MISTSQKRLQTTVQMNNKGKSGKTVKKSPRPSHSGRPVSVKRTSSGKNISGIQDRAGRRKKSSRKKKPQNILKYIVLAVVIAIVVLAVCALGYGFFEMRIEQRGLEIDQQSWSQQSSEGGGQEQWQAEGAPYIDVELLTIYSYSRAHFPIVQFNFISIEY